MNDFDNAIILFFNQYAQISTIFDKFIVILSSNHLLKGGVITALMWWVLFNVQKDSRKNKFFIISTIFGTVISVCLARSLALLLPMRHRPIHEESLNLVLPYDMESNLMDGWNSMPSDHATLFFTLSMGLYFASKKIGIFAFLYTSVFICLPRIYLGLHYPTDIIVGAIIGIGISFLVVKNSYFIVLNKRIIQLSLFHSSAFFTIIFIFTYQIADMFDSSRELIKVALLFFKSIGLY